MIVSPFSSQSLDGTVALGFLEGERGTPLRLERYISASGTVTDTEMEVKDGMACVEVTAVSIVRRVRFCLQMENRNNRSSGQD